MSPDYTPEQKAELLKRRQDGCEHAWVGTVGFGFTVSDQKCAKCGVPKVKWEADHPPIARFQVGPHAKVFVPDPRRAYWYQDVKTGHLVAGITPTSGQPVFKQGTGEYLGVCA